MGHEVKATRLADWTRELPAKKPFRLVSVALANKLARIAWAVLTRGDTCRPQAPRRLNSGSRAYKMAKAIHDA